MNYAYFSGTPFERLRLDELKDVARINGLSGCSSYRYEDLRTLLGDYADSQNQNGIIVPLHLWEKMFVNSWVELPDRRQYFIENPVNDLYSLLPACRNGIPCRLIGFYDRNNIFVPPADPDPILRVTLPFPMYR